MVSVEQTSGDGDVVAYLVVTDKTSSKVNVKGGADKSYGIQVAKLAGVPDAVIERAKHCLNELIENKGISALPDRAAGTPQDQSQISFSDMQADEIRDILKKTDLNVLTPLEAMNLLYTLQRKALS